MLIRPKQPYIDWADGLDDSDLLPTVDGEKTIYLIPEYTDEVDAMKLLSESYDIIFNAELEGWHLDKMAWPKNRTFAMFREWFDVEFHSVVEDLCGYEIVDDEFA